MSYIQNFFTSRDNNAQGNTYVGQQDRLWWDPDTNAIYVNTANTVGGTPVTLPSTVNLSVNTLTANSGNIIGDLVVGGNISPASDVKIGGVRAGPGANISNTGLLTIDTTGLPLSFGNFTANNNILTMVNVDENMILETSGNAEIQLVGNVGFYKTNGGGVPEPSALYFFARDDGQITIIVPAEDPLLGAVEIIGSSTGNLITPGQAGAMLHITGNPNVPARVYLDGNDDYASFVARRFNGNVAVPTQVLANEDVFRINATAATNAGMPNVAMAQIQMRALENQTTTAQGSTLNFLVTPIGSPASARVEVANITVANGIQATKFTTAGTVSATGNITGGNITTVGLVTATGNITAGNISATNHTGTAVSVTGNVSGGNITTVGLVTATGNITGGNILTTGLISATGNITAGNVAATTFTGNLVGNVTGTATTATNLTAATSILAGSLTVNPTNIGKNSVSTQTFTLTGLTTSHKIVITCGTALTFGITISAAWASALNTLSIEFQNATGGGVDLGDTNIQYFAWV